MLTEKQFPYSGPYGLKDRPGGPVVKTHGPTAEALSRAMGRMGKLEWVDFDQKYSLELEQALDKVDPAPATENGYTERRWRLVRGLRVPKGRPNAGEYALDRYARWLVQNEMKQSAGSTPEEEVQKFIAEFWRLAIANERNWHYNMWLRPIDVSVDPSANSVTSDCSGTVIQAAHYAMRKSGVAVNDPAKHNFSGYGNTDWFEDDWPRVGSPYRIGDMAHFHSSRHVIQCIKPGNVDTAQWGSHGHEGGPELVRSLRDYRFPGEFMAVVRPDLVK